MDLFLDIALSFPTVILSLLLALMLGYWLLALLGLFDLDAMETSLLPDGDALEVGGISGVLMKLGLDGVPLTLILTTMTLLAWLGCYYVDYMLLRQWPEGLLRTAVSWLIVPTSLVAATPFAGLVLQPLKPLFRKVQVTNEVSLLGRTAVVRSPAVDEVRGQAEIDDGGAGLILQVRAPAGRFVRGDRVVLVEYVAAHNAYRVIADGGDA
ncbi:hypothetical protein [Pseudomarimonas salicorniae]|uniref:DUF1449 family protein n=1 Tax=Pseudomarimonas salicorniae TaxID=2933270 RepID=A0ABT0GLX8_9GAMM|nr:hypothetical protein [Lysobacter sp. CAU 1642]MCK7595551.1 hypothetical protein [Lysobacter sp. CAU 1642]